MPFALYGSAMHTLFIYYIIMSAVAELLVLT